MKFYIIIFLMGVFQALSGAIVHARTCDEWRELVPTRYKSDFRSEKNIPEDAVPPLIACRDTAGKIAISYVKYKGINALMMELAPYVGVSGATLSYVMVASFKVALAYKVAEVMYKALEADKRCFENRDLKRGMMEPISHFYDEAYLKNAVNNWSCTEISKQVLAKIRAVEGVVAVKRLKQREYELAIGREIPQERRAMYDRLYPAEIRMLTEAESIFLDKRERMEKPIPLIDAVGGLLSCLKPEAMARIACGLLADSAIIYSIGKNNYSRSEGLDTDLRKILLQR